MLPPSPPSIPAPTSTGLSAPGVPSGDRARRLRRVVGRGLAALALSLALAASPLVPAAQAQGTAETPVRGGTMTIINGSDIRSWDPAITSGTYPGGPMDVLDAVYGFLVYVDVKGIVTGGMAEGLTSPDAVTWTLKLRPNLRFTDGTPFDAEAVRFNWDRIANPQTLSPAQGFVAAWAKSMTVVDATTLRITLNSPNASFAAQVAELCPFIASPAALKAAQQKTDIKPVGAGAFVLQNWNQGISMTLTRNPDYWDQPRPYLDTLKFAIIPETNSRIATVVQGGATMMAGYPFQFGSNAKASGVATREIPIRGIYRGYFNQAKGIFTDPRAREAVYEGINRARLMQAYTQVGGYTPPSSYFGTQSPYYDGSHPLPGYDPKKAQAAFDAMKRDGKPLDIRIVTYTNSDLKRLTGYVQQVLNSFDGVKATITEVDQAMLVTRCRQQLEFDLCFEGGVTVANGAEPLISNLLSSDGSFNWGQYRNPAMDAALARANATPDPAAAKAAYAEVQAIFARDLPLYIFGEETRFLLLRNNTGGIVPSNGGILQKQFLYLCPDVCVK
ncbi:ABC transporter substrate-binding protein [Roseomonas elaeocarpi]|uniref:ABC transporter substrate-binding protein n=1 Tax=Roseomonas elaeocarpi TaxID=907779 RepID=A0ABV6JWE5_9PROT